MSDERREILSKAFDKYETGEDHPVQEVVEEIQVKVEDTDAGDQGGIETPETQTTDTEVKEASESPEKEATEPKFLPPEKAESGEKGEKGAGTKEVDTEAKETGSAPVSWRGAAKSKWDEVPAAVQKEVLRREQETNKVLRETAEARKLEKEFSQTIEPYMGFIKAENSTPLQAIDNMMRIAAALRLGSPQQKASLVAQLVQNFGVDIGMLDAAIVGQPMPQGRQGGSLDPALQQYLDQRLAPVNDLMSRVNETQERRKQQTDQEIQQELDDFLSKGNATYFEDVKETMADLLDVANKQGRVMTYQQAYDTAVALDPKITAELQQHQQATVKQSQQEKEQISLARKKRASSSVTGVPVGGNGASQPTNRQEQLEAAWELHSGGRA